MGIIGLVKANLGSVKKQEEIERAMLLDHEGAVRLIGESISDILRSGLTKAQLSILETINNDHGELLNQLFSEAFQRGWNRSGAPNLSNAMDEVLRTARVAIKEY